MACLSFVTEDNTFDDAELWDFIDSTVAHRRSGYTPLLMPKPPVVTELPPSPQVTADQVRVSKDKKRQAITGAFQDEPKPLRICAPPTHRYEAGLDNSTVVRRQSRTHQPLKISRREDELGLSDSFYMSSRSSLSQIVPHESSGRQLMERTQEGNVLSENNENSGAMAVKCSPGNEWMQNIPSVSMFKHIQNAALNILDKGDYMMLQGKPFIKKSGWRKIAFFFNVSFEIRDRKIQLDQSNNVQRAEFIVRANMQSGRYADGWGSCDRGEKKFSKPNHDIASTAETRAKTRSCQDLLGIGEYKPGCDNW